MHRLLDKAHISYVPHSYDSELTDGEEIAKVLGEDSFNVYKTLVTEDQNHNHFVFCIPVDKKLDLKKAAKSAGVKSISMILQKTLLPLTGYVHGGCSPIGMRKSFPTFVQTKDEGEKIYVSAGKKGQQIELNYRELVDFIRAKTGDFVN